MPLQAVISQHAEEAAFLWTSRARAVGDPAYSLKSLTHLDDRVEAHLDGLRIAGEAAWPLCRSKLESGEASEVFPLAVLAFEGGDRERMRDVLVVSCVSAETRRALVSALGWIDHRIVAPWVDRLLQAKASVHRAVGIAACAIHRVDPGESLGAALSDPDPILRARALRAVGELKRADLLGPAHEHLADDDEACRFWAAWTLTLHDDRSGLKTLRQWQGDGGRFGVAALQLSLRAARVDESRERVEPMAKDPGLRRSAVVATGILGDPTSVPWIIGQMRSPEMSRLAGEAFATITGVDLEYHNLEQGSRPTHPRRRRLPTPRSFLNTTAICRGPNRSWSSVGGRRTPPGSRRASGIWRVSRLPPNRRDRSSRPADSGSARRPRSNSRCSSRRHSSSRFAAAGGRRSNGSAWRDDIRRDSVPLVSD